MIARPARRAAPPVETLARAGSRCARTRSRPRPRRRFPRPA